MKPTHFHLVTHCHSQLRTSHASSADYVFSLPDLPFPPRWRSIVDDFSLKHSFLIPWPFRNPWSLSLSLDDNGRFGSRRRSQLLSFNLTNTVTTVSAEIFRNFDEPQHVLLALVSIVKSVAQMEGRSGVARMIRKSDRDKQRLTYRRYSMT